jgi:RNA polymerase sigma-70 factor (ECF subfamily)
MTGTTDVGAATEIGRGLNFEWFFEAEYPRLLRAMYLLTGSVAEGEDLAQESFARIYERWEQVARMESPGGYLFRTAFNLNRRRVRGLLAMSRKIRLLAADSSDPADQTVARSDVLRAVMALPPKQRETLVLVELLEMSPDEVARLIGVRSGSVRTRLHRARASFKRLIGEGYE